jgi:hypothetical protein
LNRIRTRAKSQANHLQSDFVGVERLPINQSTGIALNLNQVLRPGPLSLLIIINQESGAGHEIGLLLLASKKAKRIIFNHFFTNVRPGPLLISKMSQ